MNGSSPGQRAVADFEIDDVFLHSAECKVDPEFNEAQVIDNVIFGHRVHVGPSIYGQIRTPVDAVEPAIQIVRYLIVGEVRMLKPGATTESEEIPDSDLLAGIKLTYAVDYRCSKALLQDQDAIRSFGKNAVFHAWPYWREGVHDMIARMRLPRITVPMLKPGSSGTEKVTQDGK